jgi:hypothetical protein
VSLVPGVLCPLSLPSPLAHSDEVKRVVGNGRQGPCEEGSLEDPFGLAVDSQGRLLIACLEGYTVLRYDPTLPDGQNLTRLAGQSGQRWFRDGLGETEALLGDVAGLATVRLSLCRLVYLSAAAVNFV